MKTKVFSILAAMVLLFSMSSCGNRANKQQEAPAPKKVLVAYYSLWGNTEKLATLIHDSIGGDVFVIEPETPYPAEDTHAYVQKQLDEGVMPVLKAKVENLEQYDVVFVGTPNWFSTMALPVKVFLQENDLSGKSVVPFVTYGGGEGNCLADIAALCPNSTILEGFAVSGDDVKGKTEEVAANVGAWLKKIEVK